MSYHAAYAARRSVSQSVDPDAGSVLDEKPHTSRHRSHAPSPFISAQALEQHAAQQKLLRLRNAPRHEREPAPSVEPPRSELEAELEAKLHKAEEHLREERDAAVLAELFGEYGSDAGGEGAWDEFQGRMAPPPVPLHKTRPHLDSPPVREATADLEGTAEWPPVAGPSGLHSRRNVGQGVARGASDSEEDMGRSERGQSARSETYAPSERSSRISLFSAASSDEDSDASGAAFDEEDERDRRSGRGGPREGRTLCSRGRGKGVRRRPKRSKDRSKRRVSLWMNPFRCWRLLVVDLCAPLLRSHRLSRGHGPPGSGIHATVRQSATLECARRADQESAPEREGRPRPGS